MECVGGGVLFVVMWVCARLNNKFSFVFRHIFFFSEFSASLIKCKGFSIGKLCGYLYFENLIDWNTKIIFHWNGIEFQMVHVMVCPFYFFFAHKPTHAYHKIISNRLTISRYINVSLCIDWNHKYLIAYPHYIKFSCTFIGCCCCYWSYCSLIRMIKW